MITPDTKNWTWVLERACDECGFDASSCRGGAVAGLVRANALTWHDLLVEGQIHPGRPTSTMWSSLEYAAHARDVYRRSDDRISAMLHTDDPTFANWDQDASAEQESYETQDPQIVVADLQRAAVGLAARLDELNAVQWQRPGRRSDGASFSIDSLARYMVHDTIHHVWDVTTARDTTGSASIQ